MVATPAAAQFSDSYNFLKAVRDRDGAKAKEFMDKPGTRIVDTRDRSTGEAALHIAVKRRDITWINFLTQSGANLNIRDDKGNTPIALAASLAFADGVRVLAARGAQVDLANDRGETPLILAVQRGDVATVRALTDAGANPAVRDTIAGMSAQDYAAQDRRLTAIAKVLESAKPKPKMTVFGPN